MDEVAEKGYAAHWKYKGKTKTDGGLDEWLNKIRELLQNPNSDALDFLDDFKLNLFSDEIYVFTPNGDLKTLPKGSKALDFAYAIHSQIGNKAIGAKVNNQLVPLNHRLHSGDQIEILSSNKQKPKEEWLIWAYTARAKSQIKSALKAERKFAIEKGKEKLIEFCKTLDIEYNDQFKKSFLKFLGMKRESNLLYKIATKTINEDDFKKFIQFNKEKSSWRKYLNPFSRLTKTETDNNLSDEIRKQLKKKPDGLLLSKKYDHSLIEHASCCKPIPGDDVIGFIEKDNSISIHRTTCQTASELMSRYGNNIIKVKWRDKKDLQFLTGLRFYGQDKFGLIKEIINVLTAELEINIRSFKLDTNHDLFEGHATIYVSHSKQLSDIIKKLQKIEGIEKIYRID